MATHDYVIANGTGAAVRSDLNNALAAIVSNNSSSSEPGTTYAYQWWADTNANVLKIRNSSNDGWITLRELDGTMLIEDGSASTPGLAFADDVNTGIFSPAADQIGFATSGAERFRIENSEVVVNEPSNDVNFRVESNSETHMLFVDAGNDRIGIKESSPTATLHIRENDSGASPDSNRDTLFIENNGNAGITIASPNTSDCAIAFADPDDNNAGEIRYSHNGNDMKFHVAGSEVARLDGDGRLLVGVSSARAISGDVQKFQVEDADGSGSGRLNIGTNNNDNAAGPGIYFFRARGGSLGSNTIVQDDDDLGSIFFQGADGTDINSRAAEIRCEVDGTPGTNDMPGRLILATTADGGASPTERLRIASNGHVGIGGEQDPDNLLHLNQAGDSIIEIENSGNGNTSGIYFVRENSAGTSKGAANIHVNSDTSRTSTEMIFGVGSNTGATSGERMRIKSNGDISFVMGNTSDSSVFQNTTNGGVYMDNSGSFKLQVARATGTPMAINRMGNDGNLVSFYQQGQNEGSISVSSNTVSYNGGHLTRWSQLEGGAERIEILRGSVLSNLDEMCVWAYEAQDAVLYTEEDELPEGVSVGDVKTPARDAGTEDNEQLNRMKVSDVEGDPNVAGVFQAWDDDDDTYTNDFYCAMTGDFVIRIAQGTTVARGDLLMSAGDGTAKPQDDDIVRSKTIAKVTSTTVSTTYSDGSYCVPCVLMAC